MKVVKVDGTVMLAANVDGGVVTDGMVINEKFVTMTLTKEVIYKYVARRNVQDLLGAMTIGTHSAVTSRDLKDEEILTVKMAEGHMDIAKVRAVRSLENEYFEGNF